MRKIGKIKNLCFFLLIIASLTGCVNRMVNNRFLSKISNLFIIHEGSHSSKIYHGKFLFICDSIFHQKQRMHGVFSLLTNGLFVKVNIKSPMGILLASIFWDNDGVKIESIDEKLDVAFYQTEIVRYMPPFLSIAAWMEGGASVYSSFKDLTLDSFGRPLHFVQDDWFIDYKYRDVSSRKIERLILSRNGDVLGCSLKIVLHMKI